MASHCELTLFASALDDIMAQVAAVPQATLDNWISLHQSYITIYELTGFVLAAERTEQTYDVIAIALAERGGVVIDWPRESIMSTFVKCARRPHSLFSLLVEMDRNRHEHPPAQEVTSILRRSGRFRDVDFEEVLEEYSRDLYEWETCGSLSRPAEGQHFGWFERPDADTVSSLALFVEMTLLLAVGWRLPFMWFCMAVVAVYFHVFILATFGA